MAENNSAVEAVILSPEKSFFRLEYRWLPDQMQTIFSMVITIHHRHNRSYGNAWIGDLSKKPKKMINEIVFSEQPKERHMLIVLVMLIKRVESSGIELGRVGELYQSYFHWQIQELLEKRAEGIFSSTSLDPIEKARKIYDLIVNEGMEAKYLWVKRIYELVREGGILTPFDAGLCEVNLYRAQSRSDSGRKYL